MSDLLLLTHRIPWPPDKGDKIRSYHILRHLASRYRVHLGTFVDSAEDWDYVPAVREHCESLCVRPAGGWRTLVRAAGALAKGTSVTLANYRDRKLQDWVSRAAALPELGGALIFSGGLAPYAAMLPAGCRKVLDMVDVDSRKWEEYAGLRGWPHRLVYRREARRLAAEETRQVARFDSTLLVSADEAQLLRQRCGPAGERVGVMPNGVDQEYFDPAADHDRPFAADERPIVFTGAMDYWANVEGVDWFAREVLPLVRQRDCRAVFYIVGSSPAREVRMLESLPGVRVTGRVEDVRPYLAHCAVAVAPLRVARGLQNKVLEAMSMACPVVTTTAAIRGIDYRGDGVTLADETGAFADAVHTDLVADRVLANRRYVADHFSWPAALRVLDRALAVDDGPGGA